MWIPKELLERPRFRGIDKISVGYEKEDGEGMTQKEIVNGVGLDLLDRNDAVQIKDTML